MTSSLPASFPATCTDLLAAMVRIDTVNPQISGEPHAEAKLAEWLECIAQDADFQTERLPFGNGDWNLLITHQADEAKPWLLFESHLDTVSVQGMTIDPFGAKIEDGKLWGRGACDTKGTGAAMLFALREYSVQPSQPHNVAVLFVCDEEITKTGALAFAGEQLPNLPWRPAGVVVGEPTNLQPVVATNGVLRGAVVTRGVAAHSSNPANGRSAITAMVRVVQHLESRYVPSLSAQHPLTGKTQASINMIHGGAQFNIIPDLCEIGFDRRLVPGECGEEELPRIEKLLDELRAEDSELQVETRLVFLDPPVAARDGDTFVAFVQGVLASLQLPNDLLGVPYCTDASQYGEVGLSCVVLGPGDILQAHTRDEWLDLGQLEKAVEVYGAIMKAGTGL